MTFVVKLNAEQVLKQVCIRACIKGRTEPCCRDYRGTCETSLIRIWPVKEILDDDAGRHALGNRCRGGEADVLMTKVVVIFSKGDRIFRPVKWLPKKQTQWLWGSRRWLLQQDWLHRQSARRMNTNDDTTGPSNAIAINRKLDVMFGDLPAIRMHGFDKPSDATTIMV